MQHQCNGDEEWRPAVDWEGIYEVSCFGHIRRIAPRKDRRRPVEVFTPRPLKPRVRGDYLSVSLSYGPDSLSWVQIHILVALAFLGPRPSADCTVNHRNGEKLDNRAANLEWSTRREQQEHARQVLFRVGPYRRLTGEQAREIYERREVSGREFARRLGVSVVTISAIRNGRLYRWAITSSSPTVTGEGTAHWSPCTKRCHCRCHYE
jgi:DNA-binding transcriptional regulator YiaG